MSKRAREDVRKRIVNFYNDAAGGNLKSTVNHFMKQGMERRMVYSILQQYRITKDLPRFGHPVKLSSRKLGDLVRKLTTSPVLVNVTMLGILRWLNQKFKEKNEY